MPDATGLELIAQELREAEAGSVLDTVFFRDRAALLVAPAAVPATLQRLRAWWCLDAEKLFDSERVREVVEERRQVVVAVGDHHGLLPAQRLGLLLDPGVEVADHGLDPAHLLAVQVDDETQHPVRRRMVRTEVDGEKLAAERPLLAGLGQRDALSDRAGFGHALSGAVCHISCSSENSTGSPPTG